MGTVNQEQIEEIIAGDLTRGQIVRKFGVGEHAAQLARTIAMATVRERRRAGSRQPSPAGLDLGVLRAAAEEYLDAKTPTLGTDRTKITLFLDWLAERYEVQPLEERQSPRRSRPT